MPETEPDTQVGAGTDGGGETDEEILRGVLEDAKTGDDLAPSEIDDGVDGVDTTEAEAAELDDDADADPAMSAEQEDAILDDMLTSRFGMNQQVLRDFMNTTLPELQRAAQANQQRPAAAQQPFQQPADGGLDMNEPPSRAEMARFGQALIRQVQQTQDTQRASSIQERIHSSIGDDVQDPVAWNALYGATVQIMSQHHMPPEKAVALAKQHMSIKPGKGKPAGKLTREQIRRRLAQRARRGESPEGGSPQLAGGLRFDAGQEDQVIGATMKALNSSRRRGR